LGLRAKRRQRRAQVWTKSSFPGWRDAAVEVDEASGNVEPFGLDAIPPEVLIITVGVDVQDDRLEAKRCAGGPERTPWCSPIA
jgi:hypothetical protein